MSQKVHVKSLRTPLRGSNQTYWYAEKNYADFWANSLCFHSALWDYYNKGLSQKAFKAPTKRRLRKATFSFSSTAVSIVGNLFITKPALFVFPRKGLSKKYIPYNTMKSKRRPVSVFKKRLTGKKYKL